MSHLRPKLQIRKKFKTNFNTYAFSFYAMQLVKFQLIDFQIDRFGISKFPLVNLQIVLKTLFLHFYGCFLSSWLKCYFVCVKQVSTCQKKTCCNSGNKTSSTLRRGKERITFSSFSHNKKELRHAFQYILSFDLAVMKCI